MGTTVYKGRINGIVHVTDDMTTVPPDSEAFEVRHYQASVKHVFDILSIMAVSVDEPVRIKLGRYEYTNPAYRRAS